MKRLVLIAAVMLAACACGQNSTQAADPAAYSGFPFGFGFYQPYGIRYSTSVRTPPYFAVNPPVYYGQRHYRPYGASPFASLPLVEAGENYRTRPADRFFAPPPQPPVVNPYCANLKGVDASRTAQVSEVREVKPSPIQINPFVAERVAVAK